MGTTVTAVGIDVSKATSDACLLLPGGAAWGEAFPSAPAGFAALLAWADRQAGGAAVHFGMEATGGSEDALATHLQAAGRAVSVVNPTRIKYAGPARGRGNKADKADARLIAADNRDHRHACGPRRPRRCGGCRPWCAAGTTCGRWPPRRRAGPTARS